MPSPPRRYVQREGICVAEGAGAHEVWVEPAVHRPPQRDVGEDVVVRKGQRGGRDRVQCEGAREKRLRRRRTAVADEPRVEDARDCGQHAECHEERQRLEAPPRVVVNVQRTVDARAGPRQRGHRGEGRHHPDEARPPGLRIATKGRA